MDLNIVAGGNKIADRDLSSIAPSGCRAPFLTSLAKVTKICNSALFRVFSFKVALIEYFLHFFCCFSSVYNVSLSHRKALSLVKR